MGGGAREECDPSIWSNIFIVIQFSAKKLSKQECIPVGCVPPTAIAVFPAMHAPCHACPPRHTHPLLCMPPTMHAPPATHTPCFACPPLCIPPLPCMLPATHTFLSCMPPVPHMPPCHACPHPCGQNSRHTLVKILPCRNFVAGGNNGLTHPPLRLAPPVWEILDPPLFHVHLHSMPPGK